MPSSFNAIDLFGPGPHRFSLAAQGNAIVPFSEYVQAFVPGSIAYGLRDLDVIVAIATRQSDPTTFAAWTAARRIEGAEIDAMFPARGPGLLGQGAGDHFARALGFEMVLGEGERAAGVEHIV